MQDPIISVSGLRGILGLSLSPDTISRYVAAFVEQLPEGPILLSRDGRPSGKALGDIVQGTINLLGRDVIDAGIAATPTVGVLLRQYRCMGAIQISASHNPSEYNGLKLMGADGRVVSAEKGAQIKAAYEEQPTTWAPWDEIGSTSLCEDTTSEHIKKVLDTITPGPIQKKKYRVLLDSNGGSGSVVGVKLLEALGCEVEVLGGDPNGDFIHPPEPTAENLKTIADRVRELRVQIAFCQDPDADRLAVIDENGRYIGEEYTVALCLQNVLAKRKGAVVINGATSQMNEDVAAEFKCPVYRSAVGEANVTQEMMFRDAVFGGEGNGGPIDPQVGYIRDSFVGMANILELMTKKKKPISKLADALPRYEIVKHKVEMDSEQLPEGFDRLKYQYKDAEVQEGDGLRFMWKNRWLIARASNTEPIVRVIAESKSFEESEDMCISAARTLRGI
ncbi:phosphoglucosamine mutase [Blastopirellula marina]|uniref:Phosphoglucosamine mutase n=1 Tax=Blastopirellula marina TaxID=124 RepID=A0A2S8G2Y2_9BACT|nr:phosphoglucosamine mutase [Blastopirellula marina]PQO38494.1 phosphoglucosamine mutase [Blastopirellula marina]PTL45151.1 phosphoglucosamine mutase [Blastopirellula marina]